METLRYFTRAYPWQSVSVLGCLLVAGLMEGLGLSAMLRQERAALLARR